MRNGLMALAALGTITISLLVLGCFYILVTNFSYIGRSARDVIEIKVFLAKDQTNYPQIYNKLMAVPGVAKVRFVSKEEGARMLEKVLATRRTFSSVKTIIPCPIVLWSNCRIGLMSKKLRSRSPRFPALMRYIMEKPLLMP